VEEQMLAATNEIEPQLLSKLGIRYHGAGIIDGDADPQRTHPQS
jgi:hypothetical protein